MNWSLIIFGLVALTSVAVAKDSYLVILPKLFKVDYDNQLSVFIASAPQPVEIKFDLVFGQKHLETKVICKAGETRNATLALPKEFPVGAAELIITGTGGLQFIERRDVIVYDNRHLMLVQTSASTYRPHDIMEIRVVATTEEFMPMEDGELEIEIYDGTLKLVGEFPRVPIRSGLTETIRFPIAEEVNTGSWVVSAIIGNTTSSVEVLVARPVTPSFDLKAIFERFLLRTDKFLRGVIEIDCDDNKPIFGRGIIAIGQIVEQDVATMKMETLKEEKTTTEEWRKWKSMEFEIAGRIELNYDLLSLFHIDVTKAIAIQVYIQVTDLTSGQERIVRHIIPIFARDIIYDIRPLEFEAGIKNEYEIFAKRPDGKPAKMEDMIVHVRMILGDEHGKQKDEKIVEIKDFYTRGRNDMGFFNLEFPENCIGVLMTITPLGEDGKERGYRTSTLPLMPTPRRTNAKLTIELLPSKVAPVNTDVNVPVISSQVSTVGRLSNFYVQLMPSKPIEKFERLPMSYVLMTNGRIILSGEFHIEPTKECNSKATRAIHPEEQTPPTCLYNGTLPIMITRDMIPYSTLLVYTFQPTFGFHVAETYRFAVAGLFQNSLTLNATIVPFTPIETIVENFDYMTGMRMEPIRMSPKVQDRSRVELSFTGVPESTVGLNVFEFDGILEGLSTEITKERLLRYLTTYEHMPLYAMPVEEESVARKEREVMGFDFSMMGSMMHDSMHGMNSGRMMPRSMNEPMMGSMSGSMDAPMHGSMHGMNSGRMMPRSMEEPMMGSMSGSMGAPMMGSMGRPGMIRRTVSEHDEELQINREEMSYETRYPFEKMMLGLNTEHELPTLEGDDIYLTSDMGRLYGDMEGQRSSSSYYRRKLEKSMNQYDVNVNDNDYVIATSIPLVFTADELPKTPKSHENKDMNVEIDSKESTMDDNSFDFGTTSWFEKMHTRVNTYTPEAFIFMHSGLSIVSDFDSLRMPAEVKHENFTRLFRRFRDQPRTFMDRTSFSMRDEARELLESYMVESDLSMMIPPIMLEEEARTGYYQSLFFNTSRIESQGIGKVVLPRTKPYSTWMATGFALNSKTGLSIAEPIRLPTNRGLFVLADCAKQARVNEHVLFSYGINNYLEKDLTNVILRIRASPDFDLIDQSKPTEILSSKDKDYMFTLPSLKSYGVETRHLVLIPKRTGLIQIIVEVESEFGGDYEILTMHVRETGVEHTRFTSRLFDLTSDKKSYGPIVEKIVDPSSLQSVQFYTSGSFLDRFLRDSRFQVKSLVGIDHALYQLYRSLGLRRYLNETLQTESPLFHMTAENITVAYQKLQFYNNYDGSYSFVADEGFNSSTLYYTTLAFGAMVSPWMPFRDNVTLNRTLTWILAHQQQDGSFNDAGVCFHYRFCGGEYRRESLTALVLYSLTRDNVFDHMPEFIRHRLFDGETSPMMRAHRFLESRIPEIKPHLLPISLLEMSFMESRFLTNELRDKIHETLLSRKLTVVPEDGSKFLKNVDDKMTFDDQLLVNAMTLSLYAKFGDFETAFDIAQWMITQLEVHPHHDSLLDAIFHVDAWYKVLCLFRKHFDMGKFDITVEVSSDKGEKQQFIINSKNMDYTQIFNFTLPVSEITYSVKGFGFVVIGMYERYILKEQPKSMIPMPFQLTQTFEQKPWLSEIKATTCMTYTPSAEHTRFIKDSFNRTMVAEIYLPSGMRINERQIGFQLSRYEYVMYFKYDRYTHRLDLFINVPSTWFGKQFCMDWALERLSSVVSWSPMKVRAYDYLQPEMEFIQYFPMQFQPAVLGYSYVDAMHAARPPLESLSRA